QAPAGEPAPLAPAAPSGPALVRLTGRQWVIIQDVRQILEEFAIVVQPRTGEARAEALRVRVEDLRASFAGAVIVFRNLAPVDPARQSGLYCLCNLARHHGVAMDIRRVMHDYAIDDEEPRDALLLKIAADYQFKARTRALPWAKLLRLGEAWPCIGVKKDGKKILMCGVRQNPEAEGRPEIAVIDPAARRDESAPFVFLSEEQFAAVYSGNAILMKRQYRLSDENQPFSLRWFVPEFLKLRGVFAQIALAVGVITLLSLIVPLFFQIVVDKVLVNKTYGTLHVLGFGVICAVLFQGFMEFVRSYYLLFATNKIDIATAMKTFRHLMRLPIDFFERVPSGVLLKHMQQTERIRGFLSGTLFFTILDLFALCIFIPFLLLYSGTLTAIVLGFSLLMALVIASLIRPFQRRLDELYQAEGKRQSMLVEAIHGIRTVKSLSLEPVEQRHWDDTTAYAIKSYFKVGQITISATSISQVLEMLMSICVIWAGAVMVFDQQITIGALIAFQMLSTRVTGPLVKMVGLIHEYQQIALSVRMLGVVMNAPAEPDGGGVREPLKGDVTFDHVSFRYRPDLPMVIRDLSLHVPHGSTIGIVGRSGSGKTTLTKLIQGLYAVPQGIIKIDGVDLR
ncbi:MAG: peptidase domain-containing ABC transporter, partial [Planctomycetes bacterium]|nr:peptidase domain-containing ABC transporter [Planctomycetota bacterium]